MFDFTEMRVFIFSDQIDMRCGFERLSYYVREKMGSDINEGNIFLFLGKNHRRLKALFFDGSGLVLITKRMEKESFTKLEDLKSSEITMNDLKHIFHGSILRKYSPNRESEKIIFKNEISPCQNQY
jgi:transposase